MNSFVRVPAIPARRTALATALCGLALFGAAPQAGAAINNPDNALVNACTGANLAGSDLLTALTPTLTSATVPVTDLLGGLLGTGAIDLTGVTTPQNLSVSALNTTGGLVSTNSYCVAYYDQYAMKTDKGISMGGGTTDGMGDRNQASASAGELDSIAIGNAAVTENTNAGAGNIAFGTQAAVTGANTVGAVAIGTVSLVGADSDGGIALGTGASVGELSPAAGGIAIGAFAAADHANSVALGAGSLTSVGAETNYAAIGTTTPQNSVGEVSIGSLGFERKLTNVAAGSADTDAVNVAQLTSVADMSVQYDSALKMSVTLGGVGATTPVTITNLADGVNPSDAVNVGQLTSGTIGLVQQVGGAPGTGVITVGAATGGTVINVTGTGGDRRITGVADGTAVNDAVTLGQLTTILSNGNYVQYDDASKQTITLGGSGGTQIRNVSTGVAPTDAANVSQLGGGGGGSAYFQANSTGTGASATGTDAVAIGMGSVSSGENAVAIGVGSVSAGTSTVAIGTNAHAYNSVAVGMNAEANGGGVALGDNSFSGNLALAVDRGTALGNGARVQGDLGTAVGTNAKAYDANSVALGANSETSRGAQTGYTASALSTPQNSAGEVSVGSVGAERQITNVAAGSAGTDAVNVNQLDAVQSNVTNQITNITNYITNTRDDLRGGVSQAMAMASLPQASLPGKRLVAAGASYYEGQSALALGVSALSDNGQWILKGQATADSQGNGGVGVGVGRHW